MFTWTFNEFGETTNIRSRIPHHKFSETNDITVIEFGLSSLSNSIGLLDDFVEFSSIDSIIGQSKSQRPS